MSSRLLRMITALLILAMLLTLTSSVLAQDEQPPPCQPTVPGTDQPVGCPQISIYGSELVGDFFLGEQLLAQGLNPALLQGVPATQSVRVDVRNIRDTSPEYGVLYTYRDTYASVWVNQGQIRNYTVYPQKQFIRGTLQVTCDIRQVTPGADVACLVWIDGVSQAEPIAPQARARYVLDPGRHTVAVEVIGADSKVWSEPPVSLWAPQLWERTVYINVGGTSYVQPIFNKKAHLLITLDNSGYEGMLADLYTNQTLAATQVVSFETWVEPYRSYRIDAQNITEPGAGVTYTWNNATRWVYVSPGQEQTVTMKPTPKWLVGFVNLTCRITNWAGENVYCQTYINGAPGPQVPPGGSVKHPLPVGSNTIRVVLGPEDAWFSKPITRTVYAYAGYTSNITTTFTLQPNVPAGAQVAWVTQVIDGDTITVQMDGASYRVRYIGIDTPESGQTCANSATNANARLVAGREVLLVRDVSETDQYGRLLRYVYVGNTFVNAWLVQNGYARAVDYPPDLRYSGLFHELEGQAHGAGLGCWATTVWVQPQPAAGGGGGGAVCDCSGNIYNCPNFSTHAQAQACFEYCLSAVGYDVHQLDGDNDGVACEALP